MTDEELAALALEGDRVALEELVSRIYPAVYKFYVKLLHSTYDAQDMTQAAVTRVIENLHKYRAGPGSRFISWTFRLSYNMFIDQTRKGRALLPGAEAFEGIPDASNGHYEAEMRNDVEEMLKCLPQEMRAMVILRYYMDMGYEEIGKALGTSAKRVKWRLHDALERMRRKAERGV